MDTAFCGRNSPKYSGNAQYIGDNLDHLSSIGTSSTSNSCGSACCVFQLRSGVWNYRCSFEQCGLSLADKTSMSAPGETMVIAIADIKASSEKCGELRKALFSLSGPTEAEAGCQSCQLYQEVSDTSTLRLETRWKTQGDLLRYIRSETYRKFLLLMELGSERPRIEFYTVSELRGLDLIREVRERPD